MPYFNTEFKISRGDIIYGLSASRVRYLEQYSKYLKTQLSQHQDKYTATEFAAELSTIDQILFKKFIMINDYNEPISEIDFLSNNLEPPISIHDIKLAHYATQLKAHPKYAPRSVQDITRETCYKNDERFYNSEFEPSPKEKRTTLNTQAIRRACKFGIEYIVSQPNQAVVHYILDGIDLKAVAMVDIMPLWTGTMGVPITTSELRYLFRNWGKFRASRRVRFYLEGEEVYPPWMSSPDLWLDYAHRRIIKYQHMLDPELVASFMQLYWNEHEMPERAFHYFFLMNF